MVNGGIRSTGHRGMPQDAEEKDEERLPALTETELYRVFDVVTSVYHAAQTRHARAGELVFVRQGRHARISLMIVGGRTHDHDHAREFTILVRGT